MDTIAHEAEKPNPVLTPGEPIGVCPLGHDWHLWRPQPELVRDARVTGAAIKWLAGYGMVIDLEGMAA